MSLIEYKKGYKYQLHKTYSCKVSIYPSSDIKTKYIDLTNDGVLIIREGYAWDGPSGPTIDTKTFMRGSLIHDAIYQLIRESRLCVNYKRQADIELKRACLEDGMSKLRAKYVYWSLKNFAGFACNPKNKKKIIKAP